MANTSSASTPFRKRWPERSNYQLLSPQLDPPPQAVDKHLQWIDKVDDHDNHHQQCAPDEWVGLAGLTLTPRELDEREAQDFQVNIAQKHPVKQALLALFPRRNQKLPSSCILGAKNDCCWDQWNSKMVVQWLPFDQGQERNRHCRSFAWDREATTGPWCF